MPHNTHTKSYYSTKLLTVGNGFCKNTALKKIFEDKAFFEI